MIGATLAAIGAALIVATTYADARRARTRRAEAAQRSDRAIVGYKYSGGRRIPRD